MVARATKGKTSPKDRIDVLIRGAAETSSEKRVLKTVVHILDALAKEKNIASGDYMQLSEHCLNVCERLRTVTQGKSVVELGKPERRAVELSEKTMREIERTLRRGTRHNGEKIHNHVLEVQRLLESFDAFDSPEASPPLAYDSTPDENLWEEHNPCSSPDGPDDISVTSAAESACNRSIERTSCLDEFPQLIEAALLNGDEDEATHNLCVDDAQALIDMIPEIIGNPNLSLLDRKRCLRLLYRACFCHALIPKAFEVTASYDRASDPAYCGGFGDVWKGDSSGRAVAVKVIRTDSRSEMKKIRKRFCREVVIWKFLQHPNVLPFIGVLMWGTRFAMVSEWMANGNINEYVKKYPGVDRLRLLMGVVLGLIYLHDIGMIHGDIKGSNILVDEAGRPRLADFGLLKIISDPANNIPSTSNTQFGTARFMGPELICPEKFGFERSRPTESSDCYAIGMVIYETISGNTPFHEHAKPTVYVKVAQGELPSRGSKFTDRLWELLEWCWAFNPCDRPSAKVVLQWLEVASESSELPAFELGGEVEQGDEPDSDQSRDISAVCYRLLESFANQVEQ